MSRIKPQEAAGYILVIGGAIWGASKLLKKGDNKEEKKTEKSVDKEIKKLEKTLPKTLPDSQYKMFADSLQSAMDDQGTDEATIYKVFNSMKNDLDYLLLYNAFGLRRKIEFGISTGEKNLIQWLQLELETEELDAIRYILKQKNIKYSV